MKSKTPLSTAAPTNPGCTQATASATSLSSVRQVSKAGSPAGLIAREVATTAEGRRRCPGSLR
jgi:hypothetical protein